MGKPVAVSDSIVFHIDGMQVSAKKGETIIQVADRYGIYIPRFCYHEQLSVVANCRMCLVEVAKAPKTLPACATQAMPDMQVFTKSKATVESQRAIMAFLLVNHPLDCPICDKGGECELQDLAMGFGEEVSKFTETKRTIHDDDIGPLIATDMTRCIHCTRCIRFGSEIAGIDELGLTGRGESTRVQTYLAGSVHSELSGNYIDVCPVGALTSKPFRYKGRSWGFTQYHTIAAHDCLGSHMYVHTSSKGYEKKTDIMRVIPATSEAINLTWLSDRDRFSYLGLTHKQRLEHPMVKYNGRWRQVTWAEALSEVQNRTVDVLKSYGPKAMGCLLSPSASCEEGYLLQKIVRGLGAVDIDHRLYMGDVNYRPLRPADGNMQDLQRYDTVLMLGSFLRHEQPILGARLRSAVLAGTKAVSVNPRAYDWHFPLADDFIVAGDALVRLLCAVCVEVVKKTKYPLAKPCQSFLASIKTDAQSRRLAKYALSKSVAWMAGAYVYSHPKADVILALLDIIVQATHADLWQLSPGANSQGLCDVGAVPVFVHSNSELSVGASAHSMMQESKPLFWLHQIEPEFDMYDSAQALAALKKAEFVLVCNSYCTEAMLDYADVLLPVSPSTEMRGSLVNTFGDKQQFMPVQKPFAQSRPAWKVYRVLANMLNIQQCNYQTIEDVQAAIADLPNPKNTLSKSYMPDAGTALFDSEVFRVGQVPLYREDIVTRRAQALQETLSADVYYARLHPDTAKRLQVADEQRIVINQQQCTVVLPLLLDESIALDALWLPAALEQSLDLGGRNDPVSITKVKV